MFTQAIIQLMLKVHAVTGDCGLCGINDPTFVNINNHIKCIESIEINSIMVDN